VSKKPLTIWFNDKGDMLTQSSSNYGNRTDKSEIAQDFDDRMQFVSLREYYRKNTRVILKSTTTGREYSMFVDDFNKAHKAKKFIDLHLEGTWRFIKRGDGQAVILVLPPESP
jgi:predicted ATP-grasp superfamily ATP-dependent carboligase